MSEVQTNTAESTTTAGAPEQPKLSRVEKLTLAYNKKRAAYEKLTTELGDIVEEINAINALANIDQGSKVLIAVGKGDTATKVEGTVLAVREDEDGKKEFKVAYGAGFDADVKVVGISKLSPIQVEPVADANQQTAE